MLLCIIVNPWLKRVHVCVCLCVICTVENRYMCGNQISVVLFCHFLSYSLHMRSLTEPGSLLNLDWLFSKPQCSLSLPPRSHSAGLQDCSVYAHVSAISSCFSGKRFPHSAISPATWILFLMWHSN